MPRTQVSCWSGPGHRPDSAAFFVWVLRDASSSTIRRQMKTAVHDFSSRSRREFLRDVAWAAAALATTGLQAQTKPPDRKLGMALLGLGRYSSNQLGPALRETKSCYLAGVITGHPEKGEKWAADYGLNKKNVY